MKIYLNNNDIRPTSLMKTYSKFYSEDIRILKKSKLVQKHCPACDSKDYTLLFKKMKFNFVACKKCDTVFVNPSPTPDALEFFYTSSKSIHFWDKIFKQTASIRKKNIFQPRIKLVSEIIKQYNIDTCKTMIEVGAGYGWFCELAKKKKLAQKIIAIEPSPTSAKSCRKIKGIQVIESTIEKINEPLYADLIVTFELVHLLFNPRSFLVSCYDTLKKNGVLIFSLTNYYGFDIQILKDKSEYVTPTFISLFNPFSIEFLLKSIGFRNVKVITPGLMDVQLIINKIKSHDIKMNSFLNFLLQKENNLFINDLQILLQKHKLSSHMLVSAQK